MKNKNSLLVSLLATVFITIPAQSNELLASLQAPIFHQHEGSSELLSGDYIKAHRKTLRALRRAKQSGASTHTQAELMNNLCVSQVLIGDISSAKSVCAIAVSTAKNARSRYQPHMKAVRSLRATTLNSRGLMHIALGNVERAESDFNSALFLQPELDEAQRNIDALVRHQLDRKMANTVR